MPSWADQAGAQLEHCRLCAGNGDVDLERPVERETPAPRDGEAPLDAAPRRAGEQILPAQFGQAGGVAADEVERGLVGEPQRALHFDDDDQIGGAFEEVAIARL